LEGQAGETCWSFSVLPVDSQLGSITEVQLPVSVCHSVGAWYIVILGLDLTQPLSIYW